MNLIIYNRFYTPNAQIISDRLGKSYGALSDKVAALARCRNLDSNKPSHAGDAILSRPIIIKIKETFKDINIILQFDPNLQYLFADLGLPITIYNPAEGPTYNAWFGCYIDLLLTHGMTYANQVYSFNRQMERQNLPYRLPAPTEHPLLRFPPDNSIKILPNSILVENGPVLSNQSDFDMNSIIPNLVNDFKNFTFYISGIPPISAPNLIDYHSLNLVSLSHVSNQCITIITKGGGVLAACYTELNYNKPKVIAGWSCPYKPWEYDFTICNSYSDIYKFINNLGVKS